MMKSVWIDTAKKPHFEPLHTNDKTDVLIIGGGMTGILCAYLLQKRGVDCILCEAEELCGGVTQNTTAKLTLQHGLFYEQTLCRLGKHIAQGYLHSQAEAMEDYRRLADDYFCDYETVDSYVYAKKDRRRLEEEVSAINALGGEARFVENLRLPFPVEGAVCVPRQAQFHPLKLAYALAKQLNVYEKTRIVELLPNGARTRYGKIYAKRVVVATHFPFENRHGLYFLKLYQHRSYVLGLENAPNLGGIYVDAEKDGLSFRNFDGMLLLGGGSHRTGKAGGNWNELEAFAKRYYPMAQEEYRWATQDCMTLDGLPYIGRYSKNTPHVFVATGYNKWGMTSSMVAAKLLADLVTDRKNPYSEVYDPSRSMLRWQTAVNLFESVKGLLTPTVPRCPHLGCALKYNKQEHSWDCPCHGSRFTKDGRLIDNPANCNKEDLRRG